MNFCFGNLLAACPGTDKKKKDHRASLKEKKKKRNSIKRNAGLHRAPVDGPLKLLRIADREGLFQLGPKQWQLDFQPAYIPLVRVQFFKMSLS